MGQQLPFEFSPRWAGLLETRRNDDRARNAEVGGFADNARDDRGWSGDDDDVRLLTEVLVPELDAARAWQAAAV